MRFALVLFAACTTSHDPMETDTDSPRVDAGPPVADAAPLPTPDAGPSDAGAGGCTSPTRGFVEVSYQPGDERGREDHAVALFWDRRTECEREVVGACTFRPCGPDTISRIAAGTVELYGEVGEEAFRYDERQGLYYLVSDFDESWSPSETVGVRASGAAFPAFELAVTIPPALELTTPPPAEITDAFEVAWTPTSGAKVEVFVVTRAGPSIVCSFPSAAGEGEVPRELLARLGETEANFSVGSSLEEEQCAPSHRVAVAAVYRAFDEWLEIRLPK